MLDVNEKHIPRALKSLEQWLLWRLEERDGKPTKVPYSIGGYKAKSNDPSTWTSYDRALQVYQRGGYSGLGFAMCEGDGLVAIDLDKCVGGDGWALTEQARTIAERFRDVAYLEKSPSGTGLRMFTYGKAQRCGKGKGDDKWIEVYDYTSPRYVTVTGNTFGPPREIGDGQEALDWLHDNYMKRDEPVRQQPQRCEDVEPLDLDDEEIIRRIRRSASGAQFEALYDRGCLSGYGNDWSSADQALCNMLAFWFQCDARRMDQVFRRSALWRTKWDKKHHSDGRTYGDGTIEKAIAACGNTYEPEKYKRSRGSSGQSGPPLLPGEQPPPDPDDPHEPDRPSLHPNRDDHAELDWANRYADWAKSLVYSKPDRDGHSYAKSVPVNAVKILTHDSRWQGVLGFNEFRHSAVWLQEPPFGPEYSISFERGKPLEELDVDRITYWLSERWGISINPERCARIVETVAQQRRFHPVREYLEGLDWDGEERIGDWLRTYMHARHESPEQLEYIQLVGKWWLMSAVARIMVPGAKADYVLVLEGKEGIRKSSALKMLAGAWFTDAAIDINNKDAYLLINGAWIVEIAELDALMKAESATAKAFFTRATDKFRPPYGRQTVEQARQSVCAGTVNHNDYIKDYTGGRRYWPVWCVRADLEALERDRDQLWAEALHRYREGERYWPEGKRQRQLCRVEQEARQIDDPWEADIVRYLIGKKKITSSDILTDAIRMDRDKWHRGHQTRIGQIMTRLGWERKRGRDSDGNMVTQYLCPKDHEGDPE